MPNFTVRGKIAVPFKVKVEADNDFDAREKVERMSYVDLFNIANTFDWADTPVTTVEDVEDDAAG